MLDTMIPLPPPNPNDHPGNDMWVDEQIWGHRLWDSPESVAHFSRIPDGRRSLPPRGPAL